MTNLLILALAPLLFLSILLMIELGHQYWLTRLPDNPELNTAAGRAIGTVLALMGLVLAFSFSNAAGRLDANRRTVLDEANAVGTAWLRIDCAAPEAQPRLRELFRQYVDARIQTYDAAGLTEYRRHIEVSDGLLRRIWALAVEGTASRPSDRLLLLPAINAVGDGAAARTLSQSTHLPPTIFVFLFGTVLIGSMLIGAMLACAGGRQWFYRIVIAAVLASIVYAIVDMEYPRLGAFNLLKDADALLLSLRKLMG
jgi:hypothetical protein